MQTSVATFILNSTFVTCASATRRINITSHFQCFIMFHEMRAFILTHEPTPTHPRKEMHSPNVLVEFRILQYSHCGTKNGPYIISNLTLICTSQQNCDVTTVGHVVFHKCSFRLKPGPLILHRKLVGG